MPILSGLVIKEWFDRDQHALLINGGLSVHSMTEMYYRCAYILICLTLHIHSYCPLSLLYGCIPFTLQCTLADYPAWLSCCLWLSYCLFSWSFIMDDYEFSWLQMITLLKWFHARTLFITGHKFCVNWCLVENVINLFGSILLLANRHMSDACTFNKKAW